MKETQTIIETNDIIDRSIYNHDNPYDDPYDEEGYDREGFDEEGFDRDGFDENGYDKDGYDKYGEHIDQTEESDECFSLYYEDCYC